MILELMSNALALLFWIVHFGDGGCRLLGFFLVPEIQNQLVGGIQSWQQLFA
jgi:hypothetical protein